MTRIAVHATALILVHNHPSGDPSPSRDDVEMTCEVAAAASTLGIKLHDHIIIGAGRYTSFREDGCWVDRSKEVTAYRAATRR